MSDKDSHSSVMAFRMNLPTDAELALVAYRRILFGRVSSLLLLLWALLTGAAVSLVLAGPERAYVRAAAAGAIVVLAFIASAKALAIVMGRYLFKYPKCFEVRVDAQGMHHRDGHSLPWEAVREIHDTPRWLFARMKGGRIPSFWVLYKRHIEPASVVPVISEAVRSNAARCGIPYHTHRYG